MSWNPFLKEPHFMLRLQQAVNSYTRKQKQIQNGSPCSSSPKKLKDKHITSTLWNKKNRSKSNDGSWCYPNHTCCACSNPIEVNETRQLSVDEVNAATEADKCLDTRILRFARNKPQTYLKVIGHLLVMSELVALLTPIVAMGIQWATALCDGPPLLAIIDLAMLGLRCMLKIDCEVAEKAMKNCIIKQRS